MQLYSTTNQMSNSIELHAPFFAYINVIDSVQCIKEVLQSNLHINMVHEMHTIRRSNALERIGTKHTHSTANFCDLFGVVKEMVKYVMRNRQVKVVEAPTTKAVHCPRSNSI